MCLCPLRSIIPSLALLFVAALAGSVLKVPTVAAVGNGSAQTLRITVMDAAGNLLPGAMVTATDAEGLDVKATEQSDGVYVIEGVWAKLTVEVDHPWFVPGSFELTLPDQPVVQVEVILGKAKPVAVIIEADKRLAPGRVGADIRFQGQRPRAAGDPPAAAAGVGNDDCADAQPIAVPSFTLGTTLNATIDDTFPTCGTGITSPGVWYSVIGTGNTITATTCTNFFGYDTKISVYCGSCEEPTCVTGNDDQCPDGANSLLSTVTWCSQVGAEYLILVHGFGGQSGDFELDVFDDGVNCQADVACVPEGACCLTGLTGECIVTTAQGCDAQGGAYQGDDTDCGGLVYPGFSDCGNPFEDISGTGTEAPNASNSDDAGDIVPIGFTFNFYGDDHTDIGVTSNGYLTFGADLTDFSNDPVPDPIDPNDLIAPLWDDFNPSSAGTVHYETRGSAPNRRFIAQWTNVPQFADNDSNTFQAILFEGSNCIEFRYLNFTPEDFGGDYTIGIENQDGSDGQSIPGADVFPGDCKVICQELVKSPCVPSCPADFDNSGAVDVKDLLFLLGAWGPCPKQGDCPADFDNSGAVDVKDLLFLLGAWGPCP